VLPQFLAALVDSQFFMKSRDHFSNAGLGETFGAGGLNLQPLQALFKIPDLFLSLL
jgi:hypothetical protein